MLNNQLQLRTCRPEPCLPSVRRDCRRWRGTWIMGAIRVPGSTHSTRPPMNISSASRRSTQRDRRYRQPACKRRSSQCQSNVAPRTNKLAANPCRSYHQWLLQPTSHHLCSDSVFLSRRYSHGRRTFRVPCCNPDVPRLRHPESDGPLLRRWKIMHVADCRTAESRCWSPWTDEWCAIGCRLHRREACDLPRILNTKRSSLACS